MKKTLKWLKWIGITLAVMIVLGVGYSFLGLQEATELTVANVDLSAVRDGTYEGDYGAFRWTTEVAVTVSDHRITAIKPITIQTGREDITNQLTQRILDQQQTDVDAVSGATASSNCFLKAVETALTDAQ